MNTVMVVKNKNIILQRNLEFRILKSHLFGEM